jgi:cytochrome c biogenesis protein CcdA
MKKKSYWIGQFVLACTTMFSTLVAVGLLRGEIFAAHWIENLAWAAAASTIFIGSRYWQARKGVACAACDVVTKK